MALNVLNRVRRVGGETAFSPVYQAHQRAYNERYSIHQQHARRWQIISVACIGLAGAAVAGLVYDDSLSKYVPYVVERDHLGDEVAVGVAEMVSPQDPRLIQADINKWIYNVRTLSTDAQTEKHNIYEAYDHTDKSGAAAGELNDWFLHNDPWKRAADTIVTVTIISTLPMEPHNWKTWLVKWKEETRTRSGDLEKSELKEASITISHKQPTTETEFKKNPTGFFVEAFDWKN